MVIEYVSPNDYIHELYIDVTYFVNEEKRFDSPAYTEIEFDIYLIKDDWKYILLKNINEDKYQEIEQILYEEYIER